MAVRRRHILVREVVETNPAKYRSKPYVIHRDESVEVIIEWPNSLLGYVSGEVDPETEPELIIGSWRVAENLGSALEVPQVPEDNVIELGDGTGASDPTEGGP